MNNQSVKKAAKEIAENHIRRNISQEGFRKIHVMAALFDGLAPLFNMVQQEINAITISEKEIAAELPPELWESWSLAKRRMFIAEVHNSKNLINRSQDNIGKIIKEQAAALDMLSPEAFDKLMDIQEVIFKAAQLYADR